MPLLGDVTQAFATEAVTIDATAGGVALTAATYKPTATSTDSRTWARRAVVSCETAQVRFRYDGTAPTATAGHILNAGDVAVIEGYPDIAAFRAIRTGSVSGTLNVTYER